MGLALGWGVRRLHNNIYTCFPTPYHLVNREHPNIWIRKHRGSDLCDCVEGFLKMRLALELAVEFRDRLLLESEGRFMFSSRRSG